jgi:hypothetical protein
MLTALLKCQGYSNKYNAKNLLRTFTKMLTCQAILVDASDRGLLGFPSQLQMRATRRLICHQIVTKIMHCTLYERDASNTPEFP